MSTAWLGLGSNIDAAANIAAAFTALSERFPGARFSPVYRSAAVGFKGDDFLNAVATVETALGPLQVKAVLTALEDARARDRSAPRWSSRTLDIDILLYDDLVLLSPELEIPRTEITRQAHVLRPLADLAPDLAHPLERRTMAELWASFEGDRARLERVPWPPAD